MLTSRKNENKEYGIGSLIDLLNAIQNNQSETIKNFIKWLADLKSQDNKQLHTKSEVLVPIIVYEYIFKFNNPSSHDDKLSHFYQMLHHLKDSKGYAKLTHEELMSLQRFSPGPLLEILPDNVLNIIATRNEKVNSLSIKSVENAMPAILTLHEITLRNTNYSFAFSLKKSALLFPFIFNYTTEKNKQYSWRLDWISPIKRNEEITQSIRLYVETCTQSYHFFKTPLNKRKPQILIESALWGRPKKIFAILNTDASFALINTKAQGKDRSGRIIEATVYQAALANDDYELCKLIEPFFNKHLGKLGEAERVRQFKEQFPESYNREANRFNFEPLRQTILNVNICNDENWEHWQDIYPDLAKMINDFKNHFSPKPNQVIRTGHYFDMQIFIDVAYAYNTDYTKYKAKYPLKGSHIDQMKCITLNHFYRNILFPFLQNLFPVRYAQAICSGQEHIVGNKPLERSIAIDSGSDVDFYRDYYKPVDEQEFSDYFVNYQKGVTYLDKPWTRESLKDMRRYAEEFKPYVEKILKQWEEAHKTAYSFQPESKMSMRATS